MEINDEGMSLNSYLDVRARLLALKFLAVANHDPQW